MTTSWIMRLLSFLGGPEVRTVAVIELALALVLWAQWRKALFLIAAVGGDGLLTTGVKRLVSRDRPGRFFGFSLAAPHSFPSGHAGGSLNLFGAISYLLWEASGRRPVILLASVPGAIVSWLIGLSRIRLHRHHRGDVIGGYLIGTVWLALVIAAFERWGRAGGDAGHPAAEG